MSHPNSTTDTTQGYTADPPTLLSIDPDGIPTELKPRRQWVGWRAEWNPELNRWNKIPLNPHTGRNANTTDPKTWGTFADALTMWQSGKANGIGFVFTEDDPYCGIDLDHSQNHETGEIDPAAWSIVERLNSYTEPSVSGTGIHVIVRGTLPDGCKARIAGHEVYQSKRFFAFTGKPLAGRAEIHERTEPLAIWHRETAKQKPTAQRATTTREVSADDAAILERVRRTQKGRSLLAGDSTGYKSRSEADMALAYLLRGAGAGDDQGEQLLSDYSLAKANRSNPDDYIHRTWAKALAEVDPWPRITIGGEPVTPHGNGPVDDLPDDVATLKAMIRELRARTADSAELEQLRTDLAEARRTISGMVHTFLNPHMVQSEKIALISALNIAEQKRQRGEIRSDGSIELTAAEISQDWRPEPMTGQPVQPTNSDGSKPRMKRQQVKPIMETLTERGFVRATPRTTIKVRANGSTYQDRVWDITPPEKPSDILAFAATWKPEEPKQRKPRSQSPVCPDCGEVHPIIRTDSCKGCGAILSTIEIKPIEDTTAHAEPEPATTTSDYVHKNSGHIESVGFPYVHKNSGHRSADQNLAKMQTRLTAPPPTPPPPVVDPGVSF